MATTSNFGWNTPDDTDLVKDGALAIRTLGNNIDTSLVDLKGGTTGQILSKNSNSDLDYTWINNDQGDITEVQAGTGISVASGTGPVPVITNTVATEFDAKGDLVVGTGADTFDKLTAGNDGETLLADSAATTGLRWQPQFLAGKNKIINGDFYWNQRNFTSVTANQGYGFDRWLLAAIGTTGTATYTPQTFTLGAAPVAGYEGRNFARVQTQSFANNNSFSALVQRIEDVRTFAGQTVTISFWAKAGSGTPNILAYLTQDFGSGGSPSAQVFAFGTLTAITTSWTRYSFTVSVPSISGKTLGTTANTSYLGFTFLFNAGTDYGTPFSTVGIQNGTFDLWGVQVEAGSVATPFSTATGTLQGELAVCQRYYWRMTGSDVYTRLGYGMATATTTAQFALPFPTTMRSAPTSVDYSTIALYDGISTFNAITAFTTFGGGSNYIGTEATVASGLTQYRPVFLVTNNNAAGYIGLNAEL